MSSNHQHQRDRPSIGSEISRVKKKRPLLLLYIATVATIMLVLQIAELKGS